MSRDAPHFDVEQAWREGWTLSMRSDDPPYAIETLDDPESVGSKAEGFDNDQDAYVHVVKQAVAGSAYHQEALFYLAAHSPEAYDWALDTYVARHGKPRFRVPAGRAA